MATILIADGQRTSRMVLERLASHLPLPTTVRSFASAEEMLTVAQDEPPVPDLLLVDPTTCGVDGEVFARLFRSVPGMLETPLLYVLGADLAGDKARMLAGGASDFLGKPVSAPEFSARCTNLIQLYEHQFQLADRTAWLQRKIGEATREIRSREEETLLRLARAGEFRDEETGMHILRMARSSRLLATGMGLPSEECVLIELAAPMHDIGKIGVSDEILRKPSRLTPVERETLQQHPQIGYDILKGSPSKYLRAGAQIALAHHECFDGSGYPGALKGEKIPLLARIVSVADVYDALTTARPYKKPWPIEVAVGYMKEQRGRQFDGDCVDVFCTLIDEITEIQIVLADDAPPPVPNASA